MEPQNSSEHRRSPPLSELLRRGLAARLTGYLELREGAIRRRITFLEGMPIFVRSNLLREHLLNFLLQNQVIEQPTYTHFLERVQGGHWSRGQTLVRSGVLTERVLRESQLRLAEEIISVCFGWKEVSYHFQPMTRQRLPQQHLLNLDPFSLYERWLAEHVSTWRLRRQVERFEGRIIRWSATGELYQEQVAPLLARHPSLRLAAQEGWSVQELFDHRDDSREDQACGLLSLFHLGILTLRRREDRPALDGQFSVMGDPSLSTSPDSVHEQAPSVHELREVAQAELKRIDGARSPFEVLGLGQSASPEEVQRAHERFEAFYEAAARPEELDSALRELIEQVRRLLLKARHDILASSGLGMSTWSSSLVEDAPPEPPSDSDDGEVALAHIFFEDGRTYLKLGDYPEAQSHFQQAVQRQPSAPRYLAHLGWASFLCAGEDLEARARGQNMLRDAISRDPLLDEAYVQLGHVYCRSGRFDRGMDMYRRALEINPRNEDARQALTPLEQG